MTQHIRRGGQDSIAWCGAPAANAADATQALLSLIAGESDGVCPVCAQVIGVLLSDDLRFYREAIQNATDEGAVHEVLRSVTRSSRDD